MYQVTIKGRSLEELKTAVNDINVELHSGELVKGMEKNLETVIDTVPQDHVLTPVVEKTVELVQEHLAAPAAPVLAGGVELDVEGIPWDKRIHAASKGKVAKGTWRTKRGLDPAVLTEVKAELLQGLHNAANPPAIPAAPITPATPPVAAPVVAPVAEVVPIVPVAAPVVEAPVAIPAAVVAPVAPPVAAPVGGHTLESFKANMAMTIGTLITEGKLTADYVNTLKTHFGVTEIWQVTEAQMEEMFNTFVQHNIVVKVG